MYTIVVLTVLVIWLKHRHYLKDSEIKITSLNRNRTIHLLDFSA